MLSKTIFSTRYDTSHSATKYEKEPTWGARGALGTLSPRSQGKGMAIAKEPSPKMTGLCSLHSLVGGEEAALPLCPTSRICSDPVRGTEGAEHSSGHRWEAGSHYSGRTHFRVNPVRQTGSRMFPVALESGTLWESVILWETG